MTFWEFSQIFTAKRRNLFRDSNFPKSYLLPIRGYSWHKNEIKMIREVITVVTTSKTQQKEKLLKRKYWVISQECFSLTPFS
jgi:hypothetical protein